MVLKKIAVVACAAMAAFAAGCGDDETSSGSSGSTAANASVLKADVSGDPIVIGTICSCTGPNAASVGKNNEIMQTWAKWTNAHGGINGHPVKVVVKDDATDAAKALKAVKELIDEDKVVAIVGEASFADTSWPAYAAEKGVPVVGGASTLPPFLTQPTFFPSGTTLPGVFYGVLDQAKREGAAKLGTMYCAEAPVCAQLPALIDGLASVVGMETYSAKVSQTAPDYTSVCLAAKDEGVDALFAAVGSSVVRKITQTCAQQDYKPLTASTTSVAASDWQGASEMEGAVLAANNISYTNDTLPAMKDFHAAMEAGLPDYVDSEQFGNTALYPWSGGELFEAAAKAAKLTPTSTPADVLKGLYALKDETLGGIAPPLNFVKGQPTMPACYFAIQVTDGKFIQPGGDEPTCIPDDAMTAIGKALAG